MWNTCADVQLGLWTIYNMGKQVSLAPKRSQTSQRMICAWNQCAQKGDEEDSR